MKRLIQMLLLLIFSAITLLGQSLNEPQLTVRQITGGQLEITWPSSMAGYTLEETDALGAGAVWHAAGTPMQQQDEFVVTITAASRSQFLRLVAKGSRL